MGFVPNARCLKLAKDAANDQLSESEILAAFQRIEDERLKMQSAGTLGADAKLREFAAKQAEAERIEAAVNRRNTALIVLVHDEQLNAMRTQVKEGGGKWSRWQALKARVYGTQRGIRGGRQSYVSAHGGFSKRYNFLKDVLKEKPHIAKLMQDKTFDRHLTEEMYELRDGGTPGKTGNSDAKYLAKVILDYFNLAKKDANKRGGNVGDIDGYFGPQNHDPIRMLKVDPKVWITRVLARLDIARTFPGMSQIEMEEVLGGIYKTITTGFSPLKPSSRNASGKVTPAGVAKSLSKSRVLHFKSVDDAIAYRAEFGRGNTIEGAMGHLMRVARINAAMDTFGPNPAVMVGGLIDQLKRDIDADASLSPTEKAKQTRELREGRRAFEIMVDTLTGEANMPDNLTLAQIGTEIRTFEIFSKLGSMLFAQVGDTIVPSIAAAFRGSNPFDAFINQIESMMIGRSDKEIAEIADMWGEGIDGFTASIINAHIGDDQRVGFLSKHAHTFFKFQGATWLTDRMRAGATRYIVREMGMRAATDFNALPPAYRHFLGLHNIDATKWEAIRQARKLIKGKHYITVDQLDALPDSAIEPLIAARLTKARAAHRPTAPLIADARESLVMDIRRLVADEVDYAVLSGDESSRTMTNLGTRPGTPIGEIVRSTMQFKAFPVVFTQRVLGRAFYGRRKGATAGEATAHMGTLVVGLMMAGYMSMVLKDLGKGYWPPRDPTDWRTIVASLMQSGAAGIYGDFLFGEANRFGGGAAETAIGPAPGSLFDLINIYQDAKGAAISGGEDPFSGTQLFNWMLGNNPVWPMNLWYTRPALDWLVLNTLRESINPGSMRRKNKRRLKEYNQTPIDISEMMGQ